MGSLLRSEPMSLVQLFLPTDSAYNCVSELGELGLTQFIDVRVTLYNNLLGDSASAYQRRFMLEIRRCDNMERILRYIEDVLKKHSIEIAEAPNVPALLPKNMTEIEEIIVRLEEEFVTANSTMDNLVDDFVELIQLRETLHLVASYVDEASDTFRYGLNYEAINQLSVHHGADLFLQVNDRSRAPTIISLEPSGKNHNEMKFIAGVINRNVAISFERVLWRWCQGNCMFRRCDFPEVPESYTEGTRTKLLFITFFYGDEIANRVRKVCDGFRASVYSCPNNKIERVELKDKLAERILDMMAVIEKTAEHRQKVFYATAKNHDTWSKMVKKMKAVYCTLNMFNFDVTQKCLIAECWVPTNDLILVQASLYQGMLTSETLIQPVLNKMETERMPPTFNKVNKFTHAFQNIVDSYGSATYREINPAPWTIITFPFLFAVMFGDAGHGLLMFLSALMLVLYEKRIIAAKTTDEIFNTFFSGRYMILLMGIFSVYTGLVYNDVFSRSVNIFGSSWRNPYTKLDLSNKSGDYMYMLPPDYAFLHDRGPYPFGVDPVWNIAQNKLNFENPLKMKLSVIIGIAQMTFGLVLSLFNHLYFKSAVDVIFVWIPQILFLACIFIYLCIQIILKWIFYYVWPSWIFGFFYPSSNCAPSLLIGLINMFMLKGRDNGFVSMTDSCKDALNACNGSVKFCKNALEKCQPLSNCSLQLWYPHQDKIEMILLFVAVISVPVMLLVKPFYLRYRAKKGLRIANAGHGVGDEEEFSFGDTLVYQAIHTIEFCLGCISHTASYLRLWALSLAHSQLSEVLWTMVFDIAFVIDGYVGYIAQYAIFLAFALLTVAILLLMEGLSAFLHALRLHWVEFQSKFFTGTGYPFEPFSFERIINPQT